MYPVDTTGASSSNHDIPCMESTSSTPSAESLHHSWSPICSTPIPCPGAKVYEAADDQAVETLLQDVATDEKGRQWINQVQAKFRDNPQYHALFKYEPNALKKILMSAINGP